jgi:3',5'-cyclic-AMP phosphodiesterase
MVRILHLSDTHINGADQPRPNGVDAHGSLTRMLGDCAGLGPLDLVVVSGDVTNDGSVSGYEFAGRAVGEFARAHGAAQVYCVGNHDLRASFAQVLGSGHYGADGAPAGTPMPDAAGERAAVSQVAGYRVISLDTLVPGKIHGWLSDAQLAWLTAMLTEPAERGTVLVMHHPPIVVPGNPVHGAVMLRNAGQLADVIAGTDVEVVLCGHFHQQLTGRLGTASVVVTPGVVHRFDSLSLPHAERAVRGASATIVGLGLPGSPVSYVVSARDPAAGQVAYEASIAEVMAELAAEEPPGPR